MLSKFVVLSSSMKLGSDRESGPLIRSAATHHK